jgi:S-adenosylmethionine:tRNA ribosyltransferase-isomerase
VSFWELGRDGGRTLRVDDFDYELPEELIAQTPLENRTESRLFVVHPRSQSWCHSRFDKLLEELTAGDVLVLNDSRVIPARLFAEKLSTGGKLELLLLERQSEDSYTALVKPAKRASVGTEITFFAEGLDPSVAERIGQAVITKELPRGVREIKFQVEGGLDDFIERVGHMPLPPYIHEKLIDKERYQTVYSRRSGSVAAPTAGLHFSETLLQKIREAGIEIHFVTLHVGLGTFRPVQVEDVEEHDMHSEWYEVPLETATAINRAKNDGRRVIAVGTTALRTLESATTAGQLQAGYGETDIFIYPGYAFRMADGLITNFHLPKSTLFMLVCAWMGTDFAKRVYREAIEQRYRFFSFGDAMFITER